MHFVMNYSSQKCIVNNCLTTLQRKEEIHVKNTFCTELLKMLIDKNVFWHVVHGQLGASPGFPSLFPASPACLKSFVCLQPWLQHSRDSGQSLAMLVVSELLYAHIVQCVSNILSVHNASDTEEHKICTIVQIQRRWIRCNIVHRKKVIFTTLHFANSGILCTQYCTYLHKASPQPPVSF